MSGESPRFRHTSQLLFATGLAMVILSIAVAGSDTSEPSAARDSSTEVPFLLPALLGAILSFVGAIRLSLFVRAWPLVIGGSALLLASWLIPDGMETLKLLPGFAWTRPALLALYMLRILAIIFSTTGALRLLAVRGDLE